MRRLNTLFGEALDTLTLTVREAAEHLGSSERTLYAYRAGDRRVQPEPALRLAELLRDRAGAFVELADRLEAAACRKEDR